MMAVADLVPLTVAAPLAIAAIMLACAHRLPRRIPDVVAVLTALGVCTLCAILAAHAARHGPLVYWFGGWTPRPHVVLGIGFGVDFASAALASFVGLLFAAAFVFAWGYFDEVHAHFHVLMLLFLAAMVGFALTRDLFNLFVWFEVMSVAAFALTAYQLETHSLAGALNFTVTNSIASFLMLGGVGLIYARAGVLDFQALGRVVAHAGADPVVTGGFCLLAAALMIKGAIVPFHFWLSDAHAVAPSPVSVIFSGAMVSLGLFALTKLALQAFAGSAAMHALMHDLFTGLGCATTIIGGAMTWFQRHLKRMLAFSTIAHLGVMLIGLSTLTLTGVAGFLYYFVGHGLVKGALFMIAGILLATKASVDEFDLRGAGRDIWPAGIAMVAGGLLLGGAPLGLLDTATSLVHVASVSTAGVWAAGSILFGTALTGAAVLRAAGRIFLGLGANSGDESKAPTDKEQEKEDRPFWLMLAPCVLLLALALAPPRFAAADHAVAQAAWSLAHPALRPGPPPALPPPSLLFGCGSVLLAVLIAGFGLFRDRLPEAEVAGVDSSASPAAKFLKYCHSGLVSDYVLFIALGLAASPLSLALR